MIDALPLLLGPEGYQISRSVRLRASANAYLQRTNATTGTDPLKFTVSGWIKRGLSSATYFPLLGSDTGSAAFDFIGFSADNFAFRIRNSSSVDLVQLISTAVFRDFSAWYHFVAVYDSANATSTERVKLYVNGVQLTSFSTATYPSLNQGLTGDFLTDMQIGRTNTNSTNQNYGDGYLTEINFIDGLTPNTTTRTVGGVTQTVLTELGEFDAVTGVWKPVRWTRLFGTNGFYLNFSDNSAATAAAIGKDYSGNGNNWTPNNITLSPTTSVSYDSMLDVPTQWEDGGNGRGNYATLNPLDKTSTITAANGNLGLTLPANVAGGCGSTIAVSSGQWYAEVTPTSGSNAIIGIVLDNLSQNAANSLFSTGYGYYQFNGNKYVNGTASAYGASYAANDVIGIALDFTSLTLTFYKNNVSQGAISIAAGSYKLTISNGSSTVAQVSAWNFGQRPFAYTPPSGFKALNTLNLPTPTILNGNQYFDATTYTGTGTTQNIANSGGFRPDLVWTKLRSLSAGHNLVDSVRGVTKALYSNLTNAETTDTNGLTAFNADGFTLNGASGYNNNGATAVGWQWKEGATQGFDIVTYTGTGVARTVAHSLGVAPKMVIVKNRTAGGAGYWLTWHANMASASYYLALNLTNAQTLDGTVWNSTSPTSSVFSIGTNTTANNNGTNFVAYCFSEVAGYSRFGSYTGNASTDGPFVFCGFKPRYILIKGSTLASSWYLFDTARSTYNEDIIALNADSSANESTALASYGIDILSNGFKIKQPTGYGLNNSGQTYIFMAVAENPFKHSLAR